MGFGLIAAGVVFLFNPNINVIDFIPDFIGFLLIYAGLAKLSLINSDLSCSRRLFLWLAAVDFLKLLSFSLTSVQDPTRYLLFSFTFGVVLCLIFTPAISSLFQGISYLGMRCSAHSVMRTRRGHDAMASVKKWILIFYFLRTALSILPEASELQMFGNTGVVGNGVINYASFKTLYYILASFIVIILAVPFLFKAVGFFVSLARDGDFGADLRERYDSLTEEHSWYSRGVRLRRSALLIAAAFLLLANPSSDGMIECPLAIVCVFAALASLLLSRSQRKTLTVLIPAAVCAVLSIICRLFENTYFADYSKIEDAVHYDHAREIFDVISYLSIAQYAVAAVAFAVLLVFMRREMKVYSEKSGMSWQLSENSKLYFRITSVSGGGALLFGSILPRLCLLTAKSSENITDAASLDFSARLYSWSAAIQVILAILAFIYAIMIARTVGKSLSDDE